MCNWCMGELLSYTKKEGRRLDSRLCCTNRGHPKDRFVNRDLNTSANIPLVSMTLPARPEALRRRLNKKTREYSERELAVESFKLKLAVIAVGPTSYWHQLSTGILPHKLWSF